MEDARNGLGMDGMNLNGRKVNVAFAEGDRKSKISTPFTPYSRTLSSRGDEEHERSRCSPTAIRKGEDDAAESFAALFS